MSETRDAVPLLAARGLLLRAGTRTLVQGLTLNIEPGTLWCVLGANGSGKTTLLHTLAGLQGAAGGSVQWQGRALAAWPLAQAARLRGLLPQSLHDAFSASALEVVLQGRYPYGDRWAGESEADRAIAHQALRSVDLDGFAQRDVLTLSGGERRRVGIAALLAQDPALLLLDEPLAHLDWHHQIVVLEHLASLARRGNKAVVLSIHDLNLAFRFASHAVLLGGAQSQVGAVADVMAAEALSRTFGHCVRRIDAGTQVLFVAQ